MAAAEEIPVFAYRNRWPDLSLPRAEHASRTQITLPLFGHIGESGAERVVVALREALP